MNVSQPLGDDSVLEFVRLFIVCLIETMPQILQYVPDTLPAVTTKYRILLLRACICLLPMVNHFSLVSSTFYLKACNTVIIPGVQNDTEPSYVRYVLPVSGTCSD